ncbi:hypothetical protein ACO0QE_001827 [Hanseniaspora vineae]
MPTEQEIIDDIVRWKAKTTIHFDPIKKYINFNNSIERLVNAILPKNNADLAEDTAAESTQAGKGFTSADYTPSQILKHEMEFKILSLEVDQYLKMLENLVQNQQESEIEFDKIHDKAQEQQAKQDKEQYDFFQSFLRVVEAKNAAIHKFNKSQLSNMLTNKSYKDVPYYRILKKEYQKKIQKLELERSHDLEIMRKNEAFVNTLEGLLASHERVLSKIDDEGEEVEGKELEEDQDMKMSESDQDIEAPVASTALDDGFSTDQQEHDDLMDEDEHDAFTEEDDRDQEEEIQERGDDKDHKDVDMQEKDAEANFSQDDAVEFEETGTSASPLALLDTDAENSSVAQSHLQVEETPGPEETPEAEETN